jgi:flavin-binding protein dodecin
VPGARRAARRNRRNRVEAAAATPPAEPCDDGDRGFASPVAAVLDVAVFEGEHQPTARRGDRRVGDRVLALGLRRVMLKEKVVMAGHVYTVVELVGSSPTSHADAIEVAVSRAATTLRNLRWFEVVQMRGEIENGRIQHYQVTLKAGFTLDDG